MDNFSTKNNEPVYTLKGVGINGQLYVYADKIEISRKGVIAFMNHGLKGSKTIPISQIRSIQVKPCKLTVGYIQFGIGGSIEARRGLQQATSDENTITFSSTKYNALVNEIKNYIESEIIKHSKNSTVINNMTSQTQTTNTLSVADELKKFKELLDMDAITKDEFEQKKKELLGL
jgi:hypothetical protein